ncbi:hypothetical protein ACLOJK_015785 [Asimina triloba]
MQRSSLLYLHDNLHVLKASICDHLTDYWHDVHETFESLFLRSLRFLGCVEDLELKPFSLWFSGQKAEAHVSMFQIAKKSSPGAAIASRSFHFFAAPLINHSLSHLHGQDDKLSPKVQSHYQHIRCAFLSISCLC